MTVLIFILLLSVLVVIHELGHFFAARRAGVKVHEFGFGYPPKIWKLFTWRGTKFTLNLIPFGGFVRLDGEDADPEELAGPAPAGAFYTKSAWDRVKVIAAGPVANIVYGALAFSIVFGVIGVPKSLEDRPRIGLVAPGSPAEQAGIVVDREIAGFRGEGEFVATPKIADVVSFVSENQGKTVRITTTGACQASECATEAQEYEVYIRTAEETPEGEGSIGVAFSDFYLEQGVWYERIPRGVVVGVREAVVLGGLILQAVWQLLVDLVRGGAVPADIAGPVGIVHQASESRILSRGFLPILEFSGMLSINLGIMNLLPIPALDGGRLLFIFLEKLFGKKRIQKVEGYAHYGGFILLVGLIIFISIRDVVALF